MTVLTLDPDSGAATGIGRRTYRPRQALRDQARILGERCTWPGCPQPSWRCDLDHRTPYNHHHPDHGGHTDLNSLDPHCRWHHLLKTHTGWTVHRNPDRSLHITSPTGLTHHYDPPEHTLPGEWTDRRHGQPPRWNTRPHQSHQLSTLVVTQGASGAAGSHDIRGASAAVGNVDDPAPF